ncbi:hypothetical protein T439DRAFT_359536 [Meredithblackwellia eburnea MCA 4105]
MASFSIIKCAAAEFGISWDQSTARLCEEPRFSFDDAPLLTDKSVFILNEQWKVLKQVHSPTGSDSDWFNSTKGWGTLTVNLKSKVVGEKLRIQMTAANSSWVKTVDSTNLLEIYSRDPKVYDKDCLGF